MTTKEDAQKRLEKAEAALAELTKEVETMREGQKLAETTIQKQHATLQEQQTTIERLTGETKAVEELRRILFPGGLPTAAPATGDLRVTHSPSEVLVEGPPDEPVTYTTKERKGQILWVLLHDLKHPSSESMIGEAMVEYGWPGSHNALKDFISDMVNKDRTLLADDSSPRLYRTPSMVEFKAKDKPEKKS